MFRAFSASAASRPGKRARLTQPEALWLNYQWVTDYTVRLFEIIFRRHELKATIMTSERPMDDWAS